MKEYPILMSAPMVRGILDGRKTQTRRGFKYPGMPSSGEICAICKDGAGDWIGWMGDPDNNINFQKFTLQAYPNGGGIKCRYGKPGDRLWVRETWRPKTHSFPTGPHYEYRATADGDLTPTDGPWKPSIFMPRAASRILLEVVDVRVERLQDISEADAVAEGISFWEMNGGPNRRYDNYEVKPNQHGTGFLNDPIASYRTLWASINGADSWEANPWVWVISFNPT